MVQCSECDHWVHAACESMTDQDYEILSDLPEEAVTFLCRLCAPTSNDNDHTPKNEDNVRNVSSASWKFSVDKYFQESLLKVCYYCV